EWLGGKMVSQVGSLADVLTALGAPSGTQVSYSGDPRELGISTSQLAAFPVLRPKVPGSFVVLSSGAATDVTQPNTAGNQGVDLGPTGTAGDTATLVLTLQVPANALAVVFDFAFLSEEYPEYVGSQYNDFFSATLNGIEFALDTNNH